MATVGCYVADYSDSVQATTVSDLLNGYALDQSVDSKPLDDDVRAKLCTELAKIQGGAVQVEAVKLSLS